MHLFSKSLSSFLGVILISIFGAILFYIYFFSAQSNTGANLSIHHSTESEEEITQQTNSFNETSTNSNKLQAPTQDTEEKEIPPTKKEEFVHTFENRVVFINSMVETLQLNQYQEDIYYKNNKENFIQLTPQYLLSKTEEELSQIQKSIQENGVFDRNKNSLKKPKLEL